MKKSLFISTGTLALAGAMAGLGAFGGMAFASTPIPASAPTAIVQSVATQTTQVKPDTPNQLLEKSSSSRKETDNVNYEEQGEHQGNNGIADTANSAPEEKSATETQSGPDTDNLNIQQ